jgi:hypothetical protein
MTDQRRYTACCGLFCRDCIPSREALFEMVAALEGELDRLDFARYAALKASRDDAFAGYEEFRAYLSAVASLKCPGPCAEGGGKKDCAIRDCAKEKGYAGCWECNGFETCKLLEPFESFHGDTPRNNLRLIHEHGPDNWAAHRGPHYLWSRRP